MLQGVRMSGDCARRLSCCCIRTPPRWMTLQGWMVSAPQEIAEIKLPDLNATNIDAAMRIVEGTAKNMGITVEAPAAAA